MKDHVPALMQGFVILLPVLDGAGRAIIYSNSSSRAPSNLQTEEKIQVWWYLLHVAMENPSVTKKGFIILANSKNSRLNNFDGKWTLAASYSGDRDFPIRWRMAHVCHANAVFPLVASAVKAVLSLEQRKSFLLHNGSNERVLESLSEYLLPIHCIPTDLGGSLHVSTDAFIQERLAIEGGASDIDKISQVISSTSQSAGILADGPLQVINITETTCNGLSNPQIVGKACSNMPSEMNRYDDLKSVSQSIEAEYATTKSIVPNNNATTSPIPEKDMENSACQKLPAEQKRKSNESNLGNERKKSQPPKKSGKGTTHPGRIGDPRMNRAVQAKIDYPNLSLVAALVAGGFVFPDLDVPGMKLSTVKDTDNVTVYQRRNQLLRRLRLVREKSNKT
mmetsp:Transcript_17773/g.31317  ORF Transcript_17773/g.31317 Transcript_17773/m.31317 type:complete len:393 (-) Transcript_17773:188-1366(-)